MTEIRPPEFGKLYWKRTERKDGTWMASVTTGFYDYLGCSNWREFVHYGISQEWYRGYPKGFYAYFDPNAPAAGEVAVFIERLTAILATKPKRKRTQHVRVKGAA